jgi:hypothetical protein
VLRDHGIEADPFEESLGCGRDLVLDSRRVPKVCFSFGAEAFFELASAPSAFARIRIDGYYKSGLGSCGPGTIRPNSRGVACTNPRFSTSPPTW